MKIKLHKGWVLIFYNPHRLRKRKKYIEPKKGTRKMVKHLMSAFLLFNLTVVSNFYRILPQSIFVQFYKCFTYIPLGIFLHRYKKASTYRQAAVLKGIAAFFYLAFYSSFSTYYSFTQIEGKACFSHVSPPQPRCRSPPYPFAFEPQFKNERRKGNAKLHEQ